MPFEPAAHDARRAALAASRDLRGSRRVPSTDYVITAAVAERGFGVPHQDRHVDTLAGVLGLASVRLSD